MRRAATALAALVLALVGVLVAAPAQSETYPWRAVITFDKNWTSPSASQVRWQLSQLQPDGSWQVVEEKAWRAGSGMLGRSGRRSCVKNKGWLPSGDYRVKQWNGYPGHLIKGRAFQLDDKRCGNGTLRNDLFLHTEQGAGNSQCRDRRGDQVCRWEWPKFNDYRSAGCIKMSPRDLRRLVRRYHPWFEPGVRYPLSRVQVRVRS